MVSLNCFSEAVSWGGIAGVESPGVVLLEVPLPTNPLCATALGLSGVHHLNVSGLKSSRFEKITMPGQVVGELGNRGL